MLLTRTKKFFLATLVTLACMLGGFGPSFAKDYGHNEKLEMQLKLFGEPSTDAEHFEKSKLYAKALKEWQVNPPDSFFYDERAKKKTLKKQADLQTLVEGHKQQSSSNKSAFDQKGEFQGDWRSFRSKVREIVRGFEQNQRETQRASEKAVQFGAAGSVLVLLISIGLAFGLRRRKKKAQESHNDTDLN